jgi:hypothetical protein
MGNREWGEKLSSLVVYAVHGVSCINPGMPPRIPQFWGTLNSGSHLQLGASGGEISTFARDFHECIAHNQG